MNRKKLIQLGLPPDSVPTAIECIQAAADQKETAGKPKQVIPRIIAAPQSFIDDPHWGSLARSIITESEIMSKTQEPINYLSWGEGTLDEAAHEEYAAMLVVCRFLVRLH
jgi:hypothetical protein